MNLAATLDLATAANTMWDVLVVGAGPAGAVCARELARLGSQVLLVDQAAFPRRKVCGACLIQRGVDTLQQIGLGDLPKRHGAVPLTSFHLSARGRHAKFPGPGGVALSREILDAALVEAALTGGAQFLPEALARLGESHADYRAVTLQQPGSKQTVRARVLVAADGLGANLLAREPGMNQRVQPAARIGIGSTFDSDARSYEPGTIYMACGRAGYLGLVRIEGGRLNCAAALDRHVLREAGDPGAIAVHLLMEAGLPIPSDLQRASWRGTVPLTRSRSRLWSHRLFVVGDAAGYVEPFTGEGMAWAITSAASLASIAHQTGKAWQESLGQAWQQQYRRHVRERQRFIRAAAIALRNPALTGALVALLAQFPRLAAPFVGHLRRGR
ncbi:MAG TPA: FAD-dependent monooxygenase [Gemmataceae bacterium]|nr:FAD-dependent monooxygenase [Gemmataceae bacterium]